MTYRRAGLFLEVFRQYYKVELSISECNYWFGKMYIVGRQTHLEKRPPIFGGLKKKIEWSSKIAPGPVGDILDLVKIS